MLAKRRLGSVRQRFPTAGSWCSSNRTIAAFGGNWFYGLVQTLRVFGHWTTLPSPALEEEPFSIALLVIPQLVSHQCPELRNYRLELRSGKLLLLLLRFHAFDLLRGSRPDKGCCAQVGKT